MTNDSEEIVIRRIQRRLDRYFAELEKTKPPEQEFKQEQSPTQIVIVKNQDILQNSKSAQLELNEPFIPAAPPPLPKAVTAPPPPLAAKPQQKEMEQTSVRVPIAVKPVEHQPELSFSEPQINETGSFGQSNVTDEDHEPGMSDIPRSSKSQPPKSATPGSRIPAHHRVAPETPIDHVVLSGAPHKRESGKSIVPTILFILALLVILSVLALWYFYTSGSLAFTGTLQHFLTANSSHIRGLT